MAVVEKYLLGTNTSLMTTELNSLANNALAAASGSFSNVVGGAGDGAPLAYVELVVTFGTAPAANAGVSLWLLARPDGTNFEDGSSSVTPARAPDVVFPLRAVTTAQRVARLVQLPPGVLSPLIKNDGTGQAFASSSNTLKLLPCSYEGV